MVHYSNRNHPLRFLTLLRKVNCCLHKSISHYQGNRVFKINSKSGIFSPKKITITLEVLLYIKSNNRLLQPNELTLSFKYSTAYLVEVHSNVSTSFFDWVIVEMFFYSALPFRLDSFRPFGSRSPFSGNGQVVTITNKQATFNFTFHGLFLKINLKTSANFFI